MCIRDSDIVMLKTDTVFSAEQFVGIPVDIGSVPQNELLTVSGFGTTEHGVLSPDLRYTLLNKFDVQYCARKSGTTLSNDQFCAGDKKYRRSSPCHGDSGGPLVSMSGNLVGLLSWSQGCAGPHQPSYFTNVNSHLSLIQKSTIDCPDP